MKLDSIKTLIISRSDAIGDVILSLPLVGLLKKQNPDLKIYFLARNYTKDIIQACSYIDDFISFDELQSLEKKEALQKIKSLEADAILHVFPRKEIAQWAKEAQIPLRIGTKSRWYHWFTCNRLIKLKRKISDKHEAMLNIELAQKAGLLKSFDPDEKLFHYYGLNTEAFWPEDIDFQSDTKKVVLHPGSNLSARNWPTEHFQKLSELLKKDYQVFISGTEEEGQNFREHFDFGPNLIDLSGKLSLLQLMQFIKNIDVLVAASTGPLHIAAALEKKAIGIFPPIRPMHPGRWAPIGKKASYLVNNKDCNACRKTKSCPCMESISPQEVYNKILSHG